MEKVKIALLVIVGLLLLVQVVDRSRQPEQLAAVKQSVDELASAVKRSASTDADVVRALERLNASLTSGAVRAPTTDAPTSDPIRDGVPKLGVNFLKPVDWSPYDPAKVKGTLKYFELPPTTLNDILSNDLSTRTANGHFNSALISVDPAAPDTDCENLATSLIIENDYQSFTYRLRPGLKWQRPNIAGQAKFAWLDQEVPCTAHDFVFYLDIVRHPDVQCPALKGYYESVDKVEALDDLTLRITWKRREYTNLNMSNGMTPLPRHVYTRFEDGSEIPAAQVPVVFNQHWFDEMKQGIGVGNYRVESFEPSKTLTFIRDPGFWGPSMHFERIEWDGVTIQPDAKLVAFKNGQVHFYETMTPAQYKSEILDGGEKRFDREDGRAGPLGWERIAGIEGRGVYQYFVWNQVRPLFADKRVRRALAHAFPKQRIIAEVYHGLGSPQISTISPGHPYQNKDLVDIPFDLAAARALLAEAGWADSDGDGWLDRAGDGGRIPFRFKATYFGPNVTLPLVFAIYRDQLKELGIELSLDPCEAKELDRRQDDKDFDMMAGGWASSMSVDYEQIWHSKYADQPKSSNYGGFKNARVDELAGKLRLTFDRDERIAIAKELDAIIYDEQPYLFFISRAYLFVWQNRPDGPDDKRSTLDGVITELDRFHPWFNRAKSHWHLRRD
ncbi:MAG TPA: ABC transporter substrate-binding protein [Planctomycetota bacterium]|nr:ABC transporter substrate-binding protein [Planctomycetota bacterium]